MNRPVIYARDLIRTAEVLSEAATVIRNDPGFCLVNAGTVARLDYWATEILASLKKIPVEVEGAEA